MEHKATFYFLRPSKFGPKQAKIALIIIHVCLAAIGGCGAYFLSQARYLASIGEASFDVIEDPIFGMDENRLTMELTMAIYLPEIPVDELWLRFSISNSSNDVFFFGEDGPHEIEAGVNTTITFILLGEVIDDDPMLYLFESLAYSTAITMKLTLICIALFTRLEVSAEMTMEGFNFE